MNLITFGGKNVSDCWHGNTSELKPFARDNEMTVWPDQRIMPSRA